MLDPKFLRNDLEGAAQQLARRGFTLDTKKLQVLEDQRKDIQTLTQELQAERNGHSRNIGKAKANGEDIAPLLKEVEGLGEQLKNKENELAVLQNELNDVLMGIPNIPHESVPGGKGEEDNPELRSWGEPTQFDFEPRDHVDLGEQLGQLDFETAAKLTGSRFCVMQGPLARLHRALIQFMLDTHTREHGYREVYVPYLVNSDSLQGTGQLPKFAEDMYTVPLDGLYLIPTAEVPVTNMYANEILDNLGWKKGSDGIRVTSDGTKLEYRIKCMSDPAFIRTAEMVKDNWAKIGVKLTVQVHDRRTLYGGIVFGGKSTKDWDFLLHRSVLRPDPDHIAREYAPEPPQSWYNATAFGWENDEMQTILKKSRREMDETKRIMMIKKFQEMFADELVVIPLAHKHMGYAYRTDRFVNTNEFDVYTSLIPLVNVVGMKLKK